MSRRVFDCLGLFLSLYSDLLPEYEVSGRTNMDCVKSSSGRRLRVVLVALGPDVFFSLRPRGPFNCQCSESTLQRTSSFGYSNSRTDRRSYIQGDHHIFGAPTTLPRSKFTWTYEGTRIRNTTPLSRVVRAKDGQWVEAKMYEGN